VQIRTGAGLNYFLVVRKDLLGTVLELRLTEIKITFMKRLLSSALFAGLLFFGACSDKDSVTPDGKARLAVRLTDDPAGYQKVNIDIQDVQINVTGDDASGWQSLPGVRAGVYDLLTLVNGKDTLLVDADVPSGRLHQIRLVLGPNNSIVVDGSTIPLETPSAQQSGLKLNVQQDVESGLMYTMLLDFEAAKSILHTGNGKYILKPVIRTLLEPVGGSIAGYVKPAGITTAVYAIKGNDTATTFTAITGDYVVRGITPGDYNLYFLPTDPSFQPATLSGINVMAGKVTVADTVVLSK
jgi:hypothetical protein